MLLSFIYKVLAQVVADRMKGVLNEVISPDKYVFLPGRRLSDAVGLVADVIEAAKNEKADWYLLLVDFKKAFHSVSRSYLFSVLEKMGFPSKFVDWIKPLAQEAANQNLGLTGGDHRLAFLGNRASTDKAFILWSKKLLYMSKEDGGVGVNDPEIALICLMARRISLLLTETNELKWDIMLKASDLPLGLDTFVSYIKLLKCWHGKSERWKLACGNFMQSPLADTSPVLSRAEAEKERIVFNRHILLNGRTPAGGQKAAKKLYEVCLSNLLCPDGAGAGGLRM
ncbi:unnamed protein product [Closterium sp. NIES-65]|nr:unnamed protein product [Closterium sp. NIES-65]